MFAGFAVFISCLGLFGLASFLTEQRTKEIGIRKVLGASVGRIVCMQMIFFIKWVFVASVFAWPLAYMSMQNWLQGFAYRTKLGIMVFIVPTVLLAVITIMTVCYQTIQDAIVNPIDTLKYE
jgi:ABC-type antimicrobial peptide transport system permease subunit